MPKSKTGSKHFGLNVNRLRSRAGITQEQLAEAANIDRSYVQRIEKGESSPTIAVLSRLKSALGCTWDDLLQGC